MSKNIVYVVTYGVGKVKVFSTRHGVPQMRKVSGGKVFEIKERLALPDELGVNRVKWVAHYLKQDFILLNSKAEQRMARRLFLNGETKNHPGNPNLRPRKPVFSI